MTIGGSIVSARGVGSASDGDAEAGYRLGGRASMAAAWGARVITDGMPSTFIAIR